MAPDLADLRFPFDNPHPLEPPGEYAVLRASRPVAKATLPGGQPVWLVTRYEDVCTVLTDPRFSHQFRNASDAMKFPLGVRMTGARTIFTTDPPEHTRLRKLMAKAFTALQIEHLRPMVEGLAEQMVGELVAQGPPADLMAHVAEPLPITVTCELLGVPQQDRPLFLNWADVMFSITGNSRYMEEARAVGTKLRTYITELITVKQQQPADDLLTMLIAARDEDDLLSTEELLGLGQTMPLAGSQTSAQIAHAVLNLVSRPGQIAELAVHPKLLPVAVEELLRFSQAPTGLGVFRIATEEIELGGVTIRPGEVVLPCISSANRDENVFAQPEHLELTRKHNPHLAFGRGIHHCLGVHLGRMELQVVLERLLHHLGEFDLAVAADELSWRVRTAFSRPHVLPLQW